MADRPLFDPSRIRVPPEERPPGPAKRGPAGEGPLSVAQVNRLVSNALDDCLPPTLHVLGEIGDISRPGSGHLYFTLKDRTSELRCVMWRSAAAKLRFQPEVGMEVIATGGVEVYVPRGTYQLMVRKLEPRGVGALEVAFRQLREKLEREGLFDKARKRPIPPVPERIAVITSPRGAAIRDILQTLRRRFPAVDVFVFPTRVQGAGAAADIARTIGDMNRASPQLGGFDVAIVGRGGGSLEDLWCFNEEIVARAIVASSVPIISAVGHEVDVSIADLVADLRAATPTAAAELAAPHAADLAKLVAERRARAARALRHAARLSREQLARLSASDVLARPGRRLREQAQRVDEQVRRLDHAVRERFGGLRRQIGHAELVVLRFGSGVMFQRVRERVDARQRRALDVLRMRLQRAERALERRVGAVERVTPALRTSRYAEHVRQGLHRLRWAMAQRLDRARRRFEGRLEVLAACDPRRVLRRGYSITREAKTRRILRSIDDVRDGLRIISELADGQFRSTADDPKQPGLFDE